MTSLSPKPRASKGHKGVKNFVSKPSSDSSVLGYWISQAAEMENASLITRLNRQAPTSDREEKGPIGGPALPYLRASSLQP